MNVYIEKANVDDSKLLAQIQNVIGFEITKRNVLCMSVSSD